MSASADEDDRTQVQRPTSLPTGVAAAQPSKQAPIVDNDSHALPIGTRLDEFELTQRLGEGGFSIVYIAWDHSLDRKVALKEYMPGSLAARVGTTQIRPRSERHRETFEAGLKSFINEAKLLARFDHPALVKVYRFWEANGTAYLVMPLYEGSTLKDMVRAMPQPPDEQWLLGLLAPLTAALNVIHGEHCYHRDIAPDNVMMLTDGGKPLLLDFGAARRVIGDMTQALTVILKPGYAPVEQYAEVPGMKQGAWTDVYALAATVYWAVTGRTPPPSVGRMLSDAYVPLAQAVAEKSMTGRYSARFLEAIDRALVVLPDQRTQTIDDLRRDLGIDAGGPIRVPVHAPADADATVIRPVSALHKAPSETRVDAPEDASRTDHPRVPTSQPRAATQPPFEATAGGAAASPAKRSGALVAGATIAVVLAAGGAWWAMRSPPPSAAPATQPSTTSNTPPSMVQNTPQSAPPSTAMPAITSPTNPSPANTSPTDISPTITPPEQTAPRPQGDNAQAAEAAPATPKPERKAANRNEGRAETKAASAEKATTSDKSADKSASKTDTAARDAECAQIYQRFSLGETRPDLIERMKALKCK